ncbi:MAG: hypothetical protein JKY52_00070 [Flavobacteriales bacterium]|nr:hypothetical protein [Flavobacteriales bacterium]
MKSTVDNTSIVEWVDELCKGHDVEKLSEQFDMTERETRALIGMDTHYQNMGFMGTNVKWPMLAALDVYLQYMEHGT